MNYCFERTQFIRDKKRKKELIIEGRNCLELSQIGKKVEKVEGVIEMENIIWV